MIENNNNFADREAPPSIVFYAIRNIIRPSFILGQIPDLLDLLAMVDTFRRRAVEVSSTALSWQEYYTKDPSPDLRLLTKHEVKKIECYIAKDEADRLLYILLVKNMCLLVCFSCCQLDQFSSIPFHIARVLPDDGT